MLPAAVWPLLKRTSALALALVLLAAAGCGGDERKTSGEEGEYIEVGPATYQVQLTRLLNPRIRPDDALVKGQPAPSADEQYLAVFLRIENDGNKPYQPPRDMKVIDTVGNEYLPLDASQTGFGLDFGEQIPPDGTAPPPNSPAAEGPNAGALVLFKVKTESASDNLPLELEVPTGGKSPASIELDI
jgi:hypothetical protein